MYMHSRTSIKVYSLPIFTIEDSRTSLRVTCISYSAELSALTKDLISAAKVLSIFLAAMWLLA